MNNKSFLPLLKRITLNLPILAFLIAGGYFLGMKFDFDFTISHFESGSMGFLIFVIASAMALILFTTLTLLCKKQMTLSSPVVSPLSLFGAILAAFASVALFITELKSSREAISTSKEVYGAVQPILYLGLIGAVTVLAVGAVLILYPIDSQRGKTGHKIASILAPLSINLTMFARYFNFDEPLNGPVRNITIVIHCATLLFLLSETRLAFGERITARFYIFTSSAAASLGLGFSLGGIIYKITALSSATPGESILRLALYFAVGCVALDRLISLPKVLTEPAIETEDEDETK